MRMRSCLITLGLATVLAGGSFGASQAAVVPSAAAVKQAAPVDIVDARYARGGRAVHVSGPRGGSATAVRGGRVGGVGYRGGAVGYRGGAVGYRGYGARPWGAAAAGAAVGAAAVGAAARQCGYYPYPPCY